MTRTIYELENWSVVAEENPYIPPECQTVYLQGNVYNHPKFQNGERITTSRITKVEGRLIHTRNSIYKLGHESDVYRQWCKDNHVHVPTVEEPIRIHE